MLENAGQEIAGPGNAGGPEVEGPFYGAGKCRTGKRRSKKRAGGN